MIQILFVFYANYYDVDTCIVNAKMKSSMLNININRLQDIIIITNFQQYGTSQSTYVNICFILFVIFVWHSSLTVCITVEIYIRI